MKKEIKEVNKELGIVRVTTVDERWYALPSKDVVTGLPTYKYVPSVTWIAGHYPKGIAFYKWLAEKGWDEAEAIKSAAGDKGSKIHNAIEMWLNGASITMDMKLTNTDTGTEEDLKLEEYEAIKSFIDWYTEVKPKITKTEFVVVNEKLGYAGTVDFLAEIDGKRYIVDLKTGQNLWPEYELQLSAYKHALESELEAAITASLNLAVLQVGYRRNKASWKFTEVDDKFTLFRAAKMIWENENNEAKPKQKDYPLILADKKILDAPVKNLIAPIKNGKELKSKKS